MTFMTERHNSPATLPSFGGLMGRAILGLTDTLLTWQDRASQRRHLAELPDEMLADMGIHRAEAAHEAGKPFWRN